MFINCPHCSALVATDPATDLPPERCPRCAARLREVEPQDAEAGHPFVPDEAVDAVPAPTAPLTEAITATHVSPTSDAASAASNATTAAMPGTPMEAVPVPEVGAASAVAAEPRGRDRTPEPGTIPAPPAADGDPSKPSRHEDAAVADPAMPSVGNEAAEPAPDATAPPPSPDPAAAPAPARRDKPAPSFARTRAPVATASARRRWTLPSLIAGLSLLLALQWLLADRARLAADAGWRPFVAQLCATLRCELPPWREPSAFALLERDVRPHPDVPGALRVTATFRNDARWAQPWPQVVLTLSDVDGRAIGARAFEAGDYLGTRPTQNELASGQTATMRMDVLEPSPHVVAFAFDFR
jgi:hypothetical protein